MFRIINRKEEAASDGADPRSMTWQGGIYLCTVNDSLEADILASKLRAEGIPCVKKYLGSAEYLEIVFGKNTIGGIELYVPEEALEDAVNIIQPSADDGTLEEEAEEAVTENGPRSEPESGE